MIFECKKSIFLNIFGDKMTTEMFCNYLSIIWLTFKKSSTTTQVPRSQKVPYSCSTFFVKEVLSYFKNSCVMLFNYIHCITCQHAAIIQKYLAFSSVVVI